MKQMLRDLQAAWDALERDDFRFAEARAREVLAGAPDDAEALYLLGSTHLFEGRLQDALPPLSAAARELQRRGVCYRLGHCQFGLGDLDGAESSLRRETQAYPESASAWNTLGTVLAARERKEDALAAFQAALRLDPAHAEAGVNAASLLHAAGRNSEALPLLERVVAAHPGLAQAHHNLGQVLHALHRYEQAAASFGRARALDPQAPDALSLQVWSELFACDWQHIDAHIAALRSQARALRLPVPPFVMLSVTASPEEQLRAIRSYMEAQGAGTLPTRPRAARAPGQRLRIAYLS